MTGRSRSWHADQELDMFMTKTRRRTSTILLGLLVSVVGVTDAVVEGQQAPTAAKPSAVVKPGDRKSVV